MNAAVPDATLARPQFTADRFLIYVMSYAGLMAVIFAAAGWLQLVGAIALNALGIESGLSNSQIRVQASYDLASTLIGLIVWQAFWRLASRRIAKAPLERSALERRIFLAGVFAVTSVVVLFFVEQFVHAAFQTATVGSFSSHLHDLLAPLTFILAYGAAWICHARIGWRERSFKLPDAPHDVALYLLLSFALGFLFFGIQNVIGMAVNGRSQGWAAWIDGISFLLTGGAVWAAASVYDQARRGRRLLRVAYVYFMIAFAVALSVGEGITIGSGLLKHVFGGSGDWTFATNQIQYFVPAVAMWAFYWMVLRSQASFVAVEPGDVIRWPRRPAIAAFCLIGLVLAVSATMELAWTGLQFVLSSPSYDSWWVNNLSNGLCELGVGAVMWSLSWKLLQHSARQNPNETVAWERRWLLFTITTLSGLAALCSIVAAVYLVFSRVLGTGNSGHFVLNEAEALVGILVSSVVLTYYGRIFLAERRDRASAPSQVRVSALVAPGTDSVLAQLREVQGVQIEVVGYLDPIAIEFDVTRDSISPPIQHGVTSDSIPFATHDSFGGDTMAASSASVEDSDTSYSTSLTSHHGADEDAIAASLNRLRDNSVSRAWLVLSPSAASIYPYTCAPQPAPSASPVRPVVPSTERHDPGSSCASTSMPA